MKSELPKVAFPVLGRAMILHVLDHLSEVGFDRIVLIVGYGREIVEGLVKDRKENIQFALQAEQKGTAHAFLCAEEALKDFHGSVVVTCGDMPMIRTSTFKRLIEQHAAEKNASTVLSAVLENPKGYGRLVRGADGKLARIVEEKDATDEIRLIRETNSGTYVFESPEIFSVLRSIDTNNKQNEYYLPDAIKILNERKQSVGVCFTQDAEEALGANSQEDVAVLESIMNRRLAGV
ncbi:MAG: NTP transferase domain-containing protein [Leptospirales bacterium]|jgi:UDP-N-acetylglucosamine diphosphorylase/glucosamine-1-phosphate N-acetyltransferase|nr:NTP transferase domain-containing protein [Leptospirales bacterium]